MQLEDRGLLALLADQGGDVALTDGGEGGR